MLELQGSLLRNALESIKDVVTVANFECSATGISLQAIDANRVALVAVLLRAGDFAHYLCNRNMSMTMDIGFLAKGLKFVSNDQKFTLTADGSDIITSITLLWDDPGYYLNKVNLSSTEIKFIKQGLNQINLSIMTEKTTSVRMKRMDVDIGNVFEAEHLEMKYMNISSADIPTAAFVRMPSAKLAKICGYLRLFGDDPESVEIYVTTDGIKFSVISNVDKLSTSTLQRETALGNPEKEVRIQVKDPVSKTISLRYLNSIANETPISDTVLISLYPELPVKLEYKIGDVGYIRFYLQ